MSFRSKAVGFACLAVLAINPALASQAQAVEFHSVSEHTILSGQQYENQHVFTLGEGFGGVACESVDTSATSAAKTETENTATTVQSGCYDSFGRTVHMNNNGCVTRFHATSKSGSAYIGNADLVCPAGKSKVVTITSGGSVVCTVVFSSQENMGPGKIENVENGLKVTLEVNNMKSTSSGGFFNCGISNGEHTEGTYQGVSVIKGTATDGTSAKIWVE
jgi:hypothetical protein